MSNSVFTRPELAGPYRVSSTRLGTLRVEAATLSWPIHTISPSKATSTAEWLTALAQTLAFPTHFGANFDALYDCLCDRQILPQANCILHISHLEALGEEACDTLIAVLQAVADEWREQGRSFWALFEEPNLDLDPLPLK